MPSLKLRALCLVATAAMSTGVFAQTIYKCGDSYTMSFFGQQARIFLNGLMARNAAGALIRVSVPIEGQDIASARKLALAATEALMPPIDKGLP